MTPLQRALASLADLRLRNEWVEVSIETGTARPYRAPTMTPEKREAADALARQERHERVNIAPGDSPDPMHFDAMELRDTILTTADAMASHIAQVAGVDRLPDASWGDFAGVWIDHCSRWLEQAAEVDPNLPANVARKCDQLVLRADAMLGHITDGQTLDATCFSCGGRDAHHPLGGGKTLKMRIKHYGHDRTGVCVDRVLATNQPGCEAFVVCEGGMCQPESSKVGHWFKGHPAWSMLTEAEWLSLEIGGTTPYCAWCGKVNYRVVGPRGKGGEFCSDECAAAAAERELVDGVQRCACGNALPEQQGRGRRAKTCSDACRRTAEAAAKRDKRNTRAA